MNYKSNAKLTTSMEDYLEMIYRLSINDGFTRINELAQQLSVQPPSVTRMIQKLASIGLVDYEKYGVVRLTEAGKKRGSSLLKRHNIIMEFLKTIGVTLGIETETEKIEHAISKDTLLNIVDFLDFLEKNPDIMKKLRMYQESTIDNK
ncbi:metal-dependent transcriptional regulator [Alkaliphilus hydrothermalis]|uniref:Manganese transport regulator n=1 Tax=Alkaliphilus hydrothermalis TaxID=1482730 RepID=A0ABS2NT12_9FIRM|nr:iron dependent repressor, metal binding and dimerization domain protein [Alkaliphilus hydrothermalis]MBM7616046.1 Mn-dependent DtxR family transcriptional regulator [Alkaliphilus hydrothermalis]